MACQNETFPDEGEVASRYRHLLYNYAAFLEESNVADIKFKYKDHLKDNFEAIQDGKDLLLAFETCTPPLIHENDVSFLEEIATREHFIELQELCKKYKELECVVSAEELAKTGPEPFIGRSGEIEEIFEKICPKECQEQKAVFIHGFPGIGKTRLAKEVISSLRIYHKTLSVDLREIKTVEAVYFALMNQLDKIAKRKMDIATLVHVLTKRKKECVLLLDNADLILEPGTEDAPNITRKEFLEFIMQLARIKNPRVKLLITSRYDIRKEVKNDLIFIKRLHKMEPKDSEKLICVYSDYLKISEDDIYSIAKACGFHPLAMKIVAGRLKESGTQLLQPILKELCDPVSSKTIDTLNLLELLELNGLESQGQVERCLYQSFKALCPRSLQETALMLAVIPGTFTYKDAYKVAKRRCEDGSQNQIDPDTLDLMVKQQIVQLCRRNLLEFSAFKNSRRFKMHLLLRAAMAKISQREPSFSDCCQMAEENFLKHYNEKLDLYCNLIENDHSAASYEKNFELQNFVALLDKHKGKIELLSSEKISLLVVALDYLLSTEQRLKYYTSMEASAEKQELPNMQSLYLSHKAFEMSAIGCYPYLEIEEELNKAFKLLLQQPNQRDRHVQIIYADYFRNAALVELSIQGDGARKSHQEAVCMLEKCVKIRKKVYGCHYLTCRAYMDLSNAHFENEKHVLGLFKRNETDLALKYSKLALEMREKLGVKHFDTSTIYLNIGSCYENIAKYRIALQYYGKALGVVTSLNLDNYERTADIWWNIATTYRKKKNYKDEYEAAKKVLKMKQRDYGPVDHVGVVEALFLCGLACFDCKEIGKACGHLEDALCMSERLMKRGRENTFFWKRLKRTYIDVMHYSDQDVHIPDLQDRFQKAEEALRSAKTTMKATGQFELYIEDDELDETKQTYLQASLRYAPDDISSSEEEGDDAFVETDMDYLRMLRGPGDRRFWERCTPCCSTS